MRPRGALLLAGIVSSACSAVAPPPPPREAAAVAAAVVPENETYELPKRQGRADAPSPDQRAGVRTIDPPIEVPGRRHRASPRALELVRRADAATYRPSDHGLRALRCDVEIEVGSMGRGKTVFRAAYVLSSPGRSTLTLVSTTTTDPRPPQWGDGTYRLHPHARCKQALDDMFDGPRWERLVEPYELEMREENGKPFVLARRAPGESAERAFIDLRFGPDGTVVQDGTGDRGVAPFCASRRLLTYDRQEGLFRRRGAGLFDESAGFEQYRYETVAGIVLPVRHALMDSGLFENVSVSGVVVNPPDPTGARGK